MEIGIITGNFHDAKIHQENRVAFREEGYRRMRCAGFDCADLTALCPTLGSFYTKPLAEAIADAEKERKIAEVAGIRIHQVHGPWPTYDTTEENRKQKLVHMERAIRLTPAFGARYLVIHPDMPYGWDAEPDSVFPCQTNLELLQALLPIAEQENVIICLENMPMKGLSLSRTKRMYEFVHQINHPNLGMCLDTGHTNVFGDDCGEMVRLIAPELKVLHVHDNLGSEDTHFAPYQGTINWDRFTDALRDISFSGVFSVEANLDVRDMTKPEHLDSACRMAKLARRLADQASAPTKCSI